MTKRTVERELEEVSTEVLSSLSPSERMQLILEAKAAGKDQWVERLVETCPRNTYKLRDPAYTNRMQLMLSLAHEAVYELRKTIDRYLYAAQRQQVTDLLSMVDDSDDVAFIRSVFEDKIVDAPLPPEIWVEQLACYYRAYERFAQEILGVSMTEWLSLHWDGETIVTTATDLIELHDSLLDSDEDTKEMIVDEAAAIMFDTLREDWEDIL
jgi:hypothetical protein